MGHTEGFKGLGNILFLSQWQRSQYLFYFSYTQHTYIYTAHEQIIIKIHFKRKQ